MTMSRAFLMIGAAAALVGWGTAHIAQGSTCGRDEAAAPGGDDDSSSFAQLPRRPPPRSRPGSGAKLLAADSKELYYVNVSGENFLFRQLFNNSAAGPFNKPCPFKDCGGYVYATSGGPGNFAAALPALNANGGGYGPSPLSEYTDDTTVGAVAQTEESSQFVVVWSHILPNGTHPWHIHEDLNEFVTVMSGSGVLDIIDPDTQKVYTFPATPGRVLTLPHGFMHMFRASREGLNLLAYGDAPAATLALLPTFVAVLPEGLRSTILGQQTAEAVQEGFEWLGFPGEGNAFICEPNSDSVQKILDANAYQECSYGITDTSDSSTLPCVMKPISKTVMAETRSFVTYGSLDPFAGDAECVADGAWCSINDVSFGYSYVQAILRPRQLLAGLMPSGAMIGYVTYGSVWVAFYHPNNAYLLQFTAHENDVIYIPGDVYFMLLSLEDEGKVQLNLGIRAYEKSRLKQGYSKFRIMPLAAALEHMGPSLSGAAFYPDLKKAAQEQATSESTVLNKPLKQASLVYEMPDAQYETMKADIATWNATTILCLDSNSLCYCKSKTCTLKAGLPKCADAGIPTSLRQEASIPHARAAVGNEQASESGMSALGTDALTSKVTELQQQNAELELRLRKLEELMSAKVS